MRPPSACSDLFGTSPPNHFCTLDMQLIYVEPFAVRQIDKLHSWPHNLALKLSCLVQQAGRFSCRAAVSHFHFEPHGLVDKLLLALEQLANSVRTRGRFEPPYIPGSTAISSFFGGVGHDPKDRVGPCELKPLHVPSPRCRTRVPRASPFSTQTERTADTLGLAQFVVQTK